MIGARVLVHDAGCASASEPYVSDRFSVAYASGSFWKSRARFLASIALILLRVWNYLPRTFGREGVPMRTMPMNPCEPSPPPTTGTGPLGWALARLARRLARTRPLQPHPGWHFGIAEETANRRVRWRKRLWEYFQQRHLAVPVVLPWQAGTRVHCYLGNDLSRMLFVGGSYEPNELAVLDRVLEPGMVFLDGGANEGWFSLLAAAKIGPTGKVVAIEPSTREVARLRANLRLNGLSNVAVVQAALADQVGFAVLQVAEPEHSGQNTLGRFAHKVTSVATQETALISLDYIVRAEGLERVDVVKLDVEGAELRALRGARYILAQHRPLLLIEVLEPALRAQGCSAEMLLHFLADQGYRLCWFDPETGLPTLEDESQPHGDTLVAFHADRPFAGIGPRTCRNLEVAAPV